MIAYTPAELRTLACSQNTNPFFVGQVSAALNYAADVIEAANAALHTTINEPDFKETVWLMFLAIGYTKQYALQWPQEEAPVTFKRWFDEQIAVTSRSAVAAIPVGLSDILLEAADLISRLPDELVSRWPLADELCGFSYIGSDITHPKDNP